MLLLLVVPFVEIFVFVQVASWIGVLDALGLLLLISMVGVVHRVEAGRQRLAADPQRARHGEGARRRR